LEVVVVAVIVSVISPMIVGLMQTNQRQAEARDRRSEKIEDWARQDAVAAQAAQAADLLLQQNRKVAEAAVVTSQKLDVIHVLVNSNMTAAMQSELDATVRELAMMREVIRLNEAAGHEPSSESLSAVKATETRIAKLRAELQDRLKQAEVAKVVERQE
jgi:hypothetical protein